MKWYISSNRTVNVNISKYSIDWDKVAPSKGAQEVKEFLRNYCRSMLVLEEFRIPRTRLRVDFMLLSRKIAIEFDGVQHNKFISHFHVNRIGFLNSIRRDDKKRQALELNGYTVVNIEDRDLPLTREWFEKNYNIFL